MIVSYRRTNRPDLRRDCDVHAKGAILAANNTEPTDLIYEGIATVSCVFIVFPFRYEPTDLIYEGIATAFTSAPLAIGTSYDRTNRPDLRRDCDNFP